MPDSGREPSDDGCDRSGPGGPDFHISSGGKNFSNLGLGTRCDISEATAFNVEFSINQPVNQSASWPASRSITQPGIPHQRVRTRWNSGRTDGHHLHQCVQYRWN